MVKGPIPVVAAVILRGEKVLVTRRERTGHLDGKWEFPGGKIEKGEKRTAALRREIREELGCGIAVGRRMCRVSYRYPSKWVRLDFYRCRIVAGEPKGMEGQRVRWVTRSGLSRLPFPPADRKILVLLAGETIDRPAATAACKPPRPS